jgi:hypothetical protein
MGDWREHLPDDPDEMLRVLVDAVKAKLHSAFPVIVNKDTEDGQTVELKIATKGQRRDDEGKLTHTDYPILKSVPIHFMGGGAKDEDSVLFTHPVKVAKKEQQPGQTAGQEENDDKKSDEGIGIISSRPLDNWHDKAGSQDSIDRRTHDLSDMMFIPGVRSKPRKFKWHDNKTAQIRSFDKKHVVCQDPKAGCTVKSVEEGQKDKQGEDKDPYEKPKKYFQMFVQATGGVNMQATADQDEDDSSKTVNHRRSLTHDGHTTSWGKPGKDDVHTNVMNSAGIKMGVDAESDPKHVMHLKAGDSGGIFSTSTKTVDVSAPTHNVQASTNIEGSGHVIKATSGETKLDGKARTTDDHTFDKNANVQQVLTAAQGLFGSVGGSGGGTMGGNTPGGNAGATSGVGSGGMAENAAAYNVGDLGGDLDGTLPNPTVIGITHIVDANLLPTSAGAAGTLYVYDDGTRKYLCVA